MDWNKLLYDIFVQFPIVFLVGLAVWYAAKQVREKEVRLEQRFDTLFANEKTRADEHEKQLRAREDKLRKEAREDRDDEIKRYLESQKPLQETNEKLLAAKDEQIARLTDVVENLTKQVTALTKKLSG